MLQAIREKAQGWIAWVIVILITIPFALWGINEYLGIGGEPVAAKVNDQEITERELDRASQNMRMQLPNFRAGSFDETWLKQQALSSLIRNAVLTQNVFRQHMSANDDMVRQAIADDPLFQQAGKFNQGAYDRTLRQSGLSKDGYANQMRLQVMLSQLQQSVSNSEFTTQAEIAEWLRLREQKRELGYLTFPRDKYLALAETPTDEQIQAYYQKHSQDFRSQEKVKLQYVELSPETLKPQVLVEDAALEEYLKEHPKAYRANEERRAAHILINVTAGHEAEAKQKIEGIQKRLQAGEDFATLAKESSEDAGSASQGGDLGFFAKGVMDPAFEAAVFAMQPGELSQPVKSEFGWHLIRLAEVRGGLAKLDEVRERVTKAYVEEQARQLFADDQEQFSDLAFVQPDSLDPLQEGLNLSIRTSDWLTRESTQGDLALPPVLAAAFSEEVLQKGHNSDPIDLPNDRILVVRVVEHVEASVKPLDEVRDQVILSLRQAFAAQAATKAAQDAVTALREGKTLAEVAKAQGLEPALVGMVGRFDTKVPASILEAVFRLARPQPEKPTYDQVDLGNGDQAVLALTQVVDGKVGDKTKKTAAELSFGRGRASLGLYLTALKQLATVTLTKKAEASEP